MAGIAYLVETLLGLSKIFTAQLHSLRLPLFKAERSEYNSVLVQIL